MGTPYDWAALAAEGIEALAVALMVGYVLFGTARWLWHNVRGAEDSYAKYRVILGRSLLLGLELLVAADIIRTVTIEPTLANLGALAVLVAVRTVLGWTITVEVEGRWPWQH